MSFGTRLADERKRLGLKQAEFARLVGTNVPKQSLYENDKRELRAAFLARVAEAGVDIVYVLTGRRSLYECSARRSACTTIRGYVTRARTALRNLDPRSDAARRLNATLNYLGRPGERNGVTIIPTSLARGTTASAASGGQIRVDIRQINRTASNSAYAAANPGASRGDIQEGLGAGSVVHEARHELDLSRIGSPNSRAAEYRSELNAYRTEQGVYQGLSLTTALWSRSMSQSQLDAAAAAGAQASTDAWCRSGAPC